MEFVYFVIVAALLITAGAAGAFVYLVRRTDRNAGIREMLTGGKWKIECILCLSGFAVALLVFLQGFPGGDKTYIRALIDGLTALWLMVAGYIDLREKIIPNVLVGVGLIFWAAVMLLDIFVGGTPWASALKFSMSGGLVVGGILFVIALVMKSALGMGDVKMFFMLGLLYGLYDTYTILLVSMAIMALVALVLLAMKKVTAKTTVPMAPFVVAGFLLYIFAGM